MSGFVGLAVAVALSAILTPTAVRSAAVPTRPTLEGPDVVRADARLVVSFRVTGSMSDEILERIHSGIPVEFEHDVQVAARRAVPLWPSRVLARDLTHVEVTYDPLTRSYDLLRRRERRRGGRPEPSVPEERSTVTSMAEVEDWMAVVETAWPIDVLTAARLDRLRLRVESTLGRRYVLLLFPGRVTVRAEREIEP